MPHATTPPPIEENESEDNYVAKEELFGTVINRITTATEEAVPSSPAYSESDPQPFLTYWRDIFQKVYNEVIADESIPEHITNPPSKKFEACLFDRPHGMRCPCCLPDVPADLGLVIENDAGVTKGEVVDRMGKWLFGETKPLVFQEYWDEDSSESGDGAEVVSEKTEGSSETNDAVASDTIGRVDDDEPEYLDTDEGVQGKRRRVVVYSTNWMSGSNWMRNPENREKKWVYGAYPKIFLYGCAVEEFNEEKNELEKPVEEAEGNQIIADDQGRTIAMMGRVYGHRPDGKDE